MEFIDSPTERTTAATDVILAVVALGCAAGVLPARTANPLKVWLWAAAFALLAIAALVGSVIHGIKLHDATKSLLWQAVNLSLGLTVALFVVAAVGDIWGPSAARMALPGMALVALAFYGLSRSASGGFLLFLAYEAAALLFALVVFGILAWWRDFPGAWWLVSGVLLSIIAAAVQAGRSARFTLVWEFDHNGIFHMVQMVALLALLVGVRASLADRP